MKASGPAAIFEGNPYEMHRYQQHQLGTRLFAGNGDIWRYVYGGATTGTDFVAGKLYVATARVDNHSNLTVAATTAVGDKSVTLDVGGTALTADQYAEGTLIFNDNSPEGEWYGITHHGTSSAGSEEVTFYVEPALKTVSTIDSSEATVQKNPYRIPAIGQLITEKAIGVPVQDWDLSAYEQYGWLKSHGIASVLVDSGGTTVGYMVVISDSTDGAVGAAAGDQTERFVGQMMDTGTNGEYNPVFLYID